MPLVNNNVTCLLLDHVNCSLAYVRLRTFVESLENLEVLHINYGKLDHTKLMWIIRDVAQNSKTLEDLSIDGNPIGVDGLKDLYQTLLKNPNITQVSITDCFETENTPETNTDLLKTLVSLCVKDKPTFVISIRFGCIGVVVSLSNCVRLKPVGPAGFYSTEENIEEFKSVFQALKDLPPVIDSLIFYFKLEGEVVHELLSKLKHGGWRELTIQLKETDEKYLKHIGTVIKCFSKKINVHFTMSGYCAMFTWKYNETEEDRLLDTYYTGFKFTVETSGSSENNTFYCKMSEKMTPVIVSMLEGNHINKLVTKGVRYVPWSDITGLVDGDIYIDGESMADLHRIERGYMINKHITAYLKEVSTRCHTITTIDMSGPDSLQEDNILQLNNVINSQTELTILNFSGCSMSSDDIRTLSAGLKQHKESLEELHLDYNIVGDAAGDLSKSLINHDKLRVLNLDCCEMSPDDIRTLSAGLKQHKGSLEELHLNDNTVGDAAGDLSKSLINHDKLRVLDLDCCEMSPDDIRTLSAGLKQYKGSLEELHLGDNTVGDAAGDLSKSLINHDKLRVLGLRWCKMSPDDIRTLSAGLKQHKGSLEELRLSGNTVGDAAGELAASLKNHDKLKSLY